MANQQIGGIPILKYFDLGGIAGRGGAVRFFFLSSGIQYKENLVDHSRWGELKQQVISSGENPAGVLPVVYVGERIFTECHAIMRRFSRQLGLYGQDLDRDYKVDNMADATVGWRNEFVAATFGNVKKEEYIRERRPFFYDLFEILVQRFEGQGAHVVGDTLSFADALVFTILHDDMAAYGGDNLHKYPRLQAFYTHFKGIEAVNAWCESVAKSSSA